jgi:uncharacterized phage protein (TIGR02218 family)
MKDVTQAYIDKEEAVQRKPVELYHVWRDAGVHWRYTDGDVSVTFGGDVYNPATLSRTSTKYDARLEVTTLEITASFVTDPTLEFISINPIEILWISVSKLHRDQDPLEADVIFVGQIKSVSFKGTTASITCVGFEHFLRQPVPKWRYQLTCNHIVFDSKCTLVEANYKTTATVTLDSTGTKLTSATFGGEVDGYFTGGKVLFGDEARTVISHVGSVVTLMYKFRELEDNNSVDAYPGCDGRAETCRDKYNNIINYLGFPFIPEENPAMRMSW